jgi:hypothetical protein
MQSADTSLNDSENNLMIKNMNINQKSVKYAQGNPARALRSKMMMRNEIRNTQGVETIVVSQSANSSVIKRP